jgi:uncharacterized protein involved in tolerance to divalent cations
MYKLLINPYTNTQSIYRIADITVIPMDESNTDYQEYLKWVAEGNTPEPADE